MYGISPGFGPTDPNVNRLVDETLSIVEDVEKRLQVLKVGIAQSFPHVVPTLQAKELRAREETAALLARTAPGTPFGIPQIGQQLYGIPGAQQIPGFGFGTPQVTPFGAIGANVAPQQGIVPGVGGLFPQTNPGAIGPYGAMGGSPFQGVHPFRPW